VLAAACWLAVPAARADGDPASDVLLTESVFIPYYVQLPKASTSELKQVVGEAKAQGYTVRVALIGNHYDLGSVAVFWLRPKPYARFLGQELAVTGLYKNRVLVVMPNGYAIARNGKALPAEQKVLDGLPSPAESGKDVATAALTAVQRLAAHDGVKLAVAVPKTEPTASGGSAAGDRLKILAGALTLLAIGVALEIGRRARRARRSPLQE
jgi:hypothetical protein